MLFIKGISKFSPLIVLSVILVSCTSKMDKPMPVEVPVKNIALNEALLRSGKNKNELLAAYRGLPKQQHEALDFLIRNMPDHDLQSLTADFLIEHVHYAYKARNSFSWVKNVPNELFLNYVLPYANLNEKRDAWRARFFKEFSLLVQQCKSLSEVGQMLNKRIFKQLGVIYSTKRSKPDLSPYEAMQEKKATCTGLSILLVDACRAMGVPARIVGTPLWSDRSGNHNWVEIWDGEWHFVGAAEPGPLNRTWFRKRAAKAKKDSLLHAIYAVSFKKTAIYFPLSWSPKTRYVSAINVTDRYTQASFDTSPPPKKGGIFEIVLRDKPGGVRVICDMILRNSQSKQVIFQGPSKGSEADINDVVTIRLLHNQRIELIIKHKEQMFHHDIHTKTIQKIRLEFYLSNNLSQKEDRVEKLLSHLQSKSLTELIKEEKELPISGHDLPQLRQHIWQKYKNEILSDPRRHKEHEKKQIHVGDKTMNYAVYKLGKAPDKGYPLYIALHGGGAAPAQINDNGWKHMKSYYRGGLKQGIYLVPRGISNTWNLHFVKESYSCYDRLIENMIVFENVDPNRIYLLGFSAGGDGVWQIASRMPDRWAAVNMSAGHPNNINLLNLHSVSFLIQVGERDSAYKRNIVSREYGSKFHALQKKYPDYYPFGLFVHKGRGHNFLDNHPAGAFQSVFLHGDQSVKKKNTNAIHWLRQHYRSPLPERLHWDLKTGANREGTSKNHPPLWSSPNRSVLHYWIGVDGFPGKKLNTEKVILHCNKKTNTVIVDEIIGNYLKLYLSEKLFGLSKPIHISIGTQELTVIPVLRLQTLLQSLVDRGDPNYMFAASIRLIKDKGKWQVL